MTHVPTLIQSCITTGSAPSAWPSQAPRGASGDSACHRAACSACSCLAWGGCESPGSTLPPLGWGTLLRDLTHSLHTHYFTHSLT